MAMKTKLTTKERLLKLVDEMDETHVRAWLTILERATAEPRAAADKGPTSADDPLWQISGMVGDEYDGPTDVSANKYQYIAEHPEIKTD